MKFVPYDAKYDMGIIELLRGHFDWMKNEDDVKLTEWLNPIFSPQMSEISKVDDLAYPFNKGLIILDSDQVVGYLGMITSRRIINDKNLIYGAPTTWAIDDKYRLYLAKAIKMILEKLDVCIDFTPRKSMELFFCKVFKFLYCGRKEYRIYPLPNNLDKIEISYINEMSCDVESVLYREFIDHKKIEGVRLVKIYDQFQGEIGYVFYKRYIDATNKVRLLKIYNSKLFVENCTEISWKILNHEFYHITDITDAFASIMENVKNNIPICMECDEMLLSNHKIIHPVVKEKDVVRLVYYKDDKKITDIDFLYSEISNLSNMV